MVETSATAMLTLRATLWSHESSHGRGRKGTRPARERPGPATNDTPTDSQSPQRVKENKHATQRQTTAATEHPRTDTAHTHTCTCSYVLEAAPMSATTADALLPHRPVLLVAYAPVTSLSACAKSRALGILPRVPAQAAQGLQCGRPTDRPIVRGRTALAAAHERAHAHSECQRWGRWRRPC